MFFVYALSAKRKNKMTRIPFYPHAGDVHIFTDSERKCIEKAYGQGTLSAEVWFKIAVATGLFTMGAPAERNAVSVKTFLRKLNGLRTLAESIRHDIPVDDTPNRQETDLTLGGLEKLVAIIKQNRKFDCYDAIPDTTDHLDTFSLLELQTLYPGLFVTFLDHILKTVVAVVDVASEARFSQYPVGGLWKFWVYWMTIIAKEHNLPYTAGAHNRKEKVPMAPFVRLIDELQKHIPKEYRRSPTPYIHRESLARAINRARKGVDTDCAFADVVDIDSFVPGWKKLVR